ncbi:hypothetical protein SIPHO049v1_p0016 [Vibrio phage PS14A.1]|nr:hypothetical protein SIPHO049v1_p0016 [Vibrio phage PS14A.1]
MITITLNQIKSENHLIEGWKKVLKANGGASADIDKPFPMSSILDSNGLDDTIWCMRCLPEHAELWIEFACWCALQNIGLIKPYCSDDSYEMIVKYLTTRDESLRKGASSAAYAVADATCAAACAAAYAVAGAAGSWPEDYEAAYEAAYEATEAAYEAAYEAADAAAYEAARAARAARESALSAQAEKLREILNR